MATDGTTVRDDERVKRLPQTSFGQPGGPRELGGETTGGRRDLLVLIYYE